MNNQSITAHDRWISCLLSPSSYFVKIFIILMLLALVAWSMWESPERKAYEQAKPLLIEKYRTHVLSIYGKGTDKAVQSWHINFYDPESPSKGRVVVIQDDTVIRSYVADGRKTYDDGLSFDPTLTMVNSETAMKVAKSYAEKNQIAYDGTRILLWRSEQGKAPSWRVEMLQDGQSKGYVFVNPEDGKLRDYARPGKRGVGIHVFGKDVADAFKGVGADLEEFFTGERTVDQ